MSSPALVTAPPTRSRRNRPRVVHVPEDHPYVRHVSAAAVLALPDASDHAGSAPLGCLTPFGWDDAADWVARHSDEFDVLHVHFGFDQIAPEQLAELLEALRAAGRAVVWTAHDLSNPHLEDQRPHEAALALLARHASAVLTLTPGAAQEIRTRWGRSAVVVRHPHLAPLDVLSRLRPDPVGPPVVGVPLGTLRPSTDLRIVRALLGLADDLAPATLRIHLREEVLSPGFPRPADDLVAELQRLDRAGRVDLRVGSRLHEADLWADLAELSALVLPYRWGTHSGWVESCYDVGTPVVAPALGRWAEQQRVHSFVSGTDGPDQASLALALRAALSEGPRHASVAEQRLRERAATVATHDDVHGSAMSGGRR